MFDQGLFLDVVVALFALINPFFAIPVFLGLTAGYDSRQQQGTAVVAAIAVVIALCVAALVGEQILYLFGIQTQSFQIAGGLIVLLIALGMSKDEPDEQAVEQPRDQRQNVAVYPLAIPLLAGPGAFVTTIVLSSRVTSLGDFLSLCAGIVVVALLLWLALALATPLARYLNQATIKIGTRILAIVLAAVAVEMIITGIDAHFLPLLQTTQPS